MGSGRDVVGHLDVAHGEGTLVEDFHGVSHFVASADAASLSRGEAFAQGEVNTSRFIDGDECEVAVVFIEVGVVDFVVRHQTVVGAIGVSNAVGVSNGVALSITGRADFSNVAQSSGWSRGVDLEADWHQNAAAWSEREGVAKRCRGRAISIVHPVAIRQRHVAWDVVGDLNGFGGHGALVEHFDAVVHVVSNVHRSGLAKCQLLAQGKVKHTWWLHRDDGEVSIVLITIFIVNGIVGWHTIVGWIVVRGGVGIRHRLTTWVLRRAYFSTVGDDSIGRCSFAEANCERDADRLTWQDRPVNRRGDLPWQGWEPVVILKGEAAWQIVGDDHILCGDGALIEDFKVERDQSSTGHGAALAFGKFLAQGEVKHGWWVHFDQRTVVVVLIAVFVVDRIVNGWAVVRWIIVR